MKRDYHDFYRRPGRIYRSNDAVFFGVCGGIAEHFDFSPWAVRLLFLVMAVMPFFTPWIIIAYVALGFLLKKAPPTPFRDPLQEEFWNVYQTSRSDALRKVHRGYQAMEKRLQRMEGIVTSPDFDLEDEYRKL